MFSLMSMHYDCIRAWMFVSTSVQAIPILIYTSILHAILKGIHAECCAQLNIPIAQLHQGHMKHKHKMRKSTHKESNNKDFIESLTCSLLLGRGSLRRSMMRLLECSGEKDEPSTRPWWFCNTKHTCTCIHKTAHDNSSFKAVHSCLGKLTSYSHSKAVTGNGDIVLFTGKQPLCTGKPHQINKNVFGL